MFSQLQSQLRFTSFRGVPFQLNDADLGAGCRMQVHECPQRDMPWVEDLGRAMRAISVNLAFGNARHCHGLNPVINRSCRDALPIGFLDNNGQCPRGHTPGLKQAGKITALAQLGNTKFYPDDQNCAVLLML